MHRNSSAQNRVKKAVTPSAVHVLERLWQRDTVKHLFNYKKKKVRRGPDLDKNFKESLKSLKEPHFQLPATNWSVCPLPFPYPCPVHLEGPWKEELPFAWADLLPSPTHLRKLRSWVTVICKLFQVSALLYPHRKWRSPLVVGPLSPYTSFSVCSQMVLLFASK